MEKIKVVTGEETRPAERVNTPKDLIIRIEKYLDRILNKVEGHEFDQRAILSLLPKKERKIMTFEIWAIFVESYGDSLRGKMYKEKCLISTKKELANILNISRPALDRYEKIGIVEKNYEGYFNLEQIKERLISSLCPD